MINIANIKVGDKVHYQPKHYNNNEWENGVVKEIPESSFDAVRVVFHCDGNWDMYKNYTSALTYVKDLRMGWRHE